MKVFSTIAYLSVVLLLFSGCSQLLQIMRPLNVQKPHVQIASVTLEKLNFSKADLSFKIEITNPNNLALSLNGFDYALLINKQRFLKGQQNASVRIQPKGTSYVRIPVTLIFKELYRTYRSLKESDSLQYTLDAGLFFSLPLLGNIRVPVTTSGKLPTLKMPQLSLKSLQLENLGFTEAKLRLQLVLRNPNAWSAALEKCNYRFVVNGAQWIQGVLKQTQIIGAKQESVLDIPIRLNLLQMGQTIYRLLAKPAPLNYELQGQAELESSIKLLGSFTLPFEQKGTIELVK